MFIWDFVAETVLGQIVNWFYGQTIGFLGSFFGEMGNMGADLFDMTWVKSIVLFFVIWLGRSMAQGWWYQPLNAELNTKTAEAVSRMLP